MQTQRVLTMDVSNHAGASARASGVRVKVGVRLIAWAMVMVVVDCGYSHGC